IALCQAEIGGAAARMLHVLGYGPILFGLHVPAPGAAHGFGVRPLSTPAGGIPLQQRGGLVEPQGELCQALPDLGVSLLVLPFPTKPGILTQIGANVASHAFRSPFRRSWRVNASKQTPFHCAEGYAQTCGLSTRQR